MKLENELKKNISLKGAGNYTPFVELEISKDIKGWSADFYELTGHPELIVRKCYTPVGLEKSIREELEKLPKFKTYEYKEKEKLLQKKKVEELIRNANQFLSMGERYGLNIAKTKYIIGIDPKTKQPDIFAVTDKIIGSNLYDNTSSVSEKVGEEIDKIYAGVYSHKKDSYLENGLYWRDFKNSQIMCGKKIGDVEDHAYIVDVDPLFNSWFDNLKDDGTWDHTETEERKEMIFWENVEIMTERMQSAENKTPGKNFIKAREMLKQIFNNIPEPTISELAKYSYNIVCEAIKN